MITQDIQKAAEVLKSGELVAFPTETVYGLGADACQADAVKKIFHAKNRPIDHPVIVHIYDEQELKNWVEYIPDNYFLFAQHCWPGPLTLIFQAKKTVSPFITGQQPTIGIRMPSHPVARALLKQFGSAIAAPSANRFGRISPTRAKDVQEELGDKIQLIIDGGDCPYGIESTIIDITQEIPVILRPGPLDVQTLQAMTGIKKIHYHNKFIQNNIRVSGNLASHYAPQTPVELFEDNIKNNNIKNIAVLSFRSKPPEYTDNINHFWIVMPENPLYYGKIFYRTLRELDTQKLSRIYIQMPPDLPQWHAVRDRLARASGTQKS